MCVAAWFKNVVYVYILHVLYILTHFFHIDIHFNLECNDCLLGIVNDFYTPLLLETYCYHVSRTIDICLFSYLGNKLQVVLVNRKI